MFKGRSILSNNTHTPFLLAYCAAIVHKERFILTVCRRTGAGAVQGRHDGVQQHSSKRHQLSARQHWVSMLRSHSLSLAPSLCVNCVSDSELTAAQHVKPLFVTSFTMASADRVEFLESFASFGLPYLILLAAALIVAAPLAHWKLGRIHLYARTKPLPC